MPAEICRQTANAIICPLQKIKDDMEEKIMSKMKRFAAMTAALLISASTMGYLPQDSLKISNTTANAAEEEITSVEINETNFPDAIFRKYVTNHFDTKVTVADEKLSTIRFSGSFDNHGLEQVLSYMEQSCGIRAVKTQDMITLEKK